MERQVLFNASFENCSNDIVPDERFKTNPYATAPKFQRDGL
jgi:hypothetical protein